MTPVSRLTAAFAALLMLLSACGGSADTGTDVSSEAPATAPIQTEAQSAPATDDAATGGSTGTLTLSTGEVYQLSIRGCETQANDPNDLLIDDYADVSADTPDGFRFTVLHAQSRESSGGTPQVGLRGERPEGGGNPEFEYQVIGASTDPSLVTFEVDGLRVSGDAVLDGKFSSTTPFGDTVTASFDITCA